ELLLDLVLQTRIALTNLEERLLQMRLGVGSAVRVVLDRLEEFRHRLLLFFLRSAYRDHYLSQVVVRAWIVGAQFDGLVELVPRLVIQVIIQRDHAVVALQRRHQQLKLRPGADQTLLGSRFQVGFICRGDKSRDLSLPFSGSFRFPDETQTYAAIAA